MPSPEKAKKKFTQLNSIRYLPAVSQRTKSLTKRNNNTRKGRPNNSSTLAVLITAKIICGYMGRIP